MKITVYGICKNEEKHVRRFLDHARCADYICLLDTGSEDGTREAVTAWALKHLNDTEVMLSSRPYEPWCCGEEYDEILSMGGRPFRFDEARNESMKLIPPDTDVCVCLDLDEILCPGWRAAIERYWSLLDTTGRYEYVWNFRPDGSDGVKFLGEKVHRYGRCRWVGAVHEVMKYDDIRVDVQIPGLRIEHHADDGKSRGNYLPMLELAVREDPENDRNVHYLGREFFFRGRYEKAVETLRHHLVMETAHWKAERAASMRYIGVSYQAMGDMEQAEAWLKLAAGEAQEQREPLIELAKLYLAGQNWSEAVRQCEKALTRTERPMTYMSEAYAWGEGPWDLMSVALWYEGKYQSAVECCRKALELNGSDERIRNNLRMMEAQRG